MENRRYYLNQKEIKEYLKNAEKIYHTITVLCYFCNEQPEIEELCNITPILNYLRKEADKLYANLFNLAEIDKQK